jgi:hypothetical protein
MESIYDNVLYHMSIWSLSRVDADKNFCPRNRLVAATRVDIQFPIARLSTLETRRPADVAFFPDPGRTRREAVPAFFLRAAF